MRIEKLLMGAFAATLALFSCNVEDNLSTLESRTVRFTSSIEGGSTTRVGNAWTGSEKVGMYMVEETAFTAVDDVVNKEFSVAVGGALTAVDNATVYYPGNGDKVRFAAYYPYAATIANNIYKVDLSAEGDNDLLYAMTPAYDKSQSETVELRFEHQLSRLVLNVKDEDNAVATGVTAKIIRNTKADFDLSTGTLSNSTAAVGLDMTASGATVEGLVMPGILSGSKIVFTFNGNAYTWDISALNLGKGKQYTYTIQLKTGAAAGVEASLSSTIVGWTLETVEGVQEVDKDPVPVVTYTAAFAGTMTERTAISAAKVTVNYTNGDGSAKDVTADVTGAGAAGISVAGQSVTLQNGDGSFELAVTGTPTASGAVTFSVKIGGTEVATVGATVDAAPVDAPVYTSNISLALTNGGTSMSSQTLSIEGARWNGIKLGTGSNFGSWISGTDIGSDKTKLSFYAMAWNDAAAKLKVTVNGGGTIDGATEKVFTLATNAGVGGSGTFTVTVNPATDFFNATLANTTAETSLTFETIADGVGKRAVFFGVNVE